MFLQKNCFITNSVFKSTSCHFQRKQRGQLLLHPIHATPSKISAKDCRQDSFKSLGN